MVAGVCTVLWAHHESLLNRAEKCWTCGGLWLQCPGGGRHRTRPSLVPHWSPPVQQIKTNDVWDRWVLGEPELVLHLANGDGSLQGSCPLTRFFKPTK